MTSQNVTAAAAATRENLKRARAKKRAPVDPAAVEAKMREYSATAGSPDNWGDAQKKEGTRKLIYQTEDQRLDMEVKAGSLITPERLQEILDRYEMVIKEEIKKLSEICSESINPGERLERRKEAGMWAKRILNAIKARNKEVC